MKEDTTIIELAHRVVEKFADRQARIGYISAEELDYAVLAQEVISINQQLTEKDATAQKWESEYRNLRRRFDEFDKNALNLFNENSQKIKQLQKQLKAVNEEIDDGPQFGMTAWDWRDWMYSVLPFLQEPSGEGDKE